jgi:hypothetical protein
MKEWVDPNLEHGTLYLMTSNINSYTYRIKSHLNTKHQTQDIPPITYCSNTHSYKGRNETVTHVYPKTPALTELSKMFGTYTDHSQTNPKFWSQSAINNQYQSEKIKQRVSSIYNSKLSISWKEDSQYTKVHLETHFLSFLCFMFYYSINSLFWFDFVRWHHY